MQAQPSRLGCLSTSAIAAAMGVALLVGGAFLLGGAGMFSPGPLNAQAGSVPAIGVGSHAQIADCAECHPAPWSGETLSDRCLQCHPEVSQDAKNFHNILFTKVQTASCRGCHTEHHGANAPLTKVVNAQEIQHNLLGYSLQAHATMGDGSAFQCSDCHKNGYAGAFDQAICATCHASLDDAFTSGHIQTFGTDCLACHDGIDTYGKAFDHAKVAFSLAGKHKTAACGGCHQGQQSLAALKTTPQTCNACHAKDDIHQGSLGPDCGQCHTPVDWQQATINHDLTSFPLTGMHTTIPCVQCHANNIFRGTPTDCFSCHAMNDAHGGDLGQDCGTCHTTAGWSPAAIDHNLTDFPLVGKHQTVDCTSCHVNNVFKGTPKDCYSCHAKDDAHAGSLGTDCSLCHTPTGWLPSTFNHALTVFPLTGAHAGLACRRCHVAGPNGINFKGTPTTCSSCHADPAYHAGLFGLNCSSCHTTSGWIPAQFNLAHSFDMNHGGAGSCQDCHPNNLNTYSCLKCHPGGAPPPEGGGGGN